MKLNNYQKRLIVESMMDQDMGRETRAERIGKRGKRNSWMGRFVTKAVNTLNSMGYEAVVDDNVPRETDGKWHILINVMYDGREVATVGVMEDLVADDEMYAHILIDDSDGDGEYEDTNLYHGNRIFKKFARNFEWCRVYLTGNDGPIDYKCNRRYEI